MGGGFPGAPRAYPREDPPRESPAALRAHLRKDPPRTAYLVHGELLLVDECRMEIRAAIRAAPGEVEHDIRRIGGAADLAGLRIGASSLSLFGERRHTEVLFFGTAPDAKAGQALLEAVDALEGSGDHIVICVGSADSRDQNAQARMRQMRKAQWFTKLAKQCETVHAAEVGRKQLPRWVDDRLKAGGQSLTREASEFFVQMTEGNLLAAQQEILKLRLLFPKGEIGIDSLREELMDLSHHNVFSLQDALRSGERTRVSRVMRNLRNEGAAPQQVLWALADEARMLLAFSEGGSPGRAVWGERKAALQAAARATSRHKVLEILGLVQQADLRAKGMDDSPRDPWDGLLSIAAKLRRLHRAGREGSGRYA